MRIYNKLVRDLIPEIIRNQGNVPLTRIADEKDFLALLTAKLLEETREFQENPSSEELADIQEVFEAMITASGQTMAEIVRIKESKARERGGFSQRIILIAVDDGTGADTV